MKKVKVFLTMAVIVISTMLCCAMSAAALTDGDWEFQLLDNEVTITGYIGNGGDVIIPDTIYGCPVTKISTSKYGNNFKDVTSLTFPSTIKVIDQSSFSFGFEKLQTVILPEGIDEIGEGAFENCNNLKEVSLPSTLKIIGTGAFRGCEALTNIKIPDSVTEIHDSVFAKTGLEHIDLSSTTVTLGDGVFFNCKNLKSIKLNESATTIPNYTFESCVNLNSVDIPKSVTYIGEKAFFQCENLKEIILPVSLQRIEKNAFSACNSLKEVVIPYGTTRLHDAFQDCKNLKSLYIPDTVTDFWILVINGSNECIIYCTGASVTAEKCKQYGISYLTDNSVNSGIHVLYNGSRVSFHSYAQNPEILEGRTLVPLRSIFEAMGASVEWDGATSTAIAKRGDIEVKIQIGASAIYKNGQAIPVDVPAQLMNDRTMVPARVIAEAFGADVQWNDNGRTVIITE